MTYKFNPKTQGSGIICCIPQTGTCPNNCHDCFFQSGRSYLEPLSENLPNVPPTKEARGRIVRINDGNDSNVNRMTVMDVAKNFPMRFYNTAIPKDLEKFDAPIVVTLNPGKMTDTSFHMIDPIPKNLMMVRLRVNTWNLETVVRPAVKFYTEKKVPVVLTFMAYYKHHPNMNDSDYIFRKRTLNSYYAITTDTWRKIMAIWQDNPFIYSCGKIEGEKGVTGCKHCGNCTREYFSTMERTRERTLQSLVRLGLDIRSETKEIGQQRRHSRRIKKGIKAMEKSSPIFPVLMPARILGKEGKK